LLAGLAAAVAGATRISGVALLPALAIEAWLVARERGDGRWLARAAAVALVAPLGLATYLATNLVAYGHPFEFRRHQESHWQHVPSTPWRELVSGITAVLEQPFTIDRVILADANVLTVLLLGATALYSFVRLRLSYAVYAAAGGWLATAVTWNISAPRYAISVWPLFWMLAAVTGRPGVAAVFGGLAGAGLGLVAVRFMTDLWAF